MKAITIKQPWANLIVEGIKDIENRTWPTSFRGRILIHSSQVPVKYDSLRDILTKEQWSSLNKNYDPFTFLNCGVILGSVEIVDCVICHESIWAERKDGRLDYNTKRWIEKPIYNWVLANPIKFPKPIKARGSLSLWNYPYILAEPEEKDGELFCHCQLSVDEKIQVSGDYEFGFYCRYCGGKWYK